MLPDAYKRHRKELLANSGAILIATEQKYMTFLCEVCLEAAPAIHVEFNRCMALRPYWENYAPEQRGRKPKGESIPWGEVGEKTISYNIVKVLLRKRPDLTFPGLPFGGDIRFATDDALVHFDVKLTGPNDNPDEVVASRNQISGDGIRWNKKGVVNSPVKVQGPRASMDFQPELPPFYIEGTQRLVCLTYFLKAVYRVESMGEQPLDYMEIICCPNGLLAFDGPKYINHPNLFIPGKDEKKVKHKRARLRLSPLSEIADWRCVKIVREGDHWTTLARRSQLHQ